MTLGGPRTARISGRAVLQYVLRYVKQKGVDSIRAIDSLFVFFIDIECDKTVI